MGLFGFIKRRIKKNTAASSLEHYLTREPRRIPYSEHRINRTSISRRALKVVEDLQRAGHSAYLVGGCVRDLLVGRKPKDFDVVTDATPQRIKEVFRFARIIGRRFRIVHVPFGAEIIETATFRALPPAGGADEILLRDNVYGSEREDALRRDISINALLYDPVSQTIIDYVDGYRDIKRRIVRMIRDPYQSYTEDPVRMIRALKYRATTGFEIEATSYQPITELAGLINGCSTARVMEELYKILRSGAARATMDALYRSGLLAHIAPEIAASIDRGTDSLASSPLGERLAALDSLTAGGRIWSNGVLLAVLFADIVPPIQGGGTKGSFSDERLSHNAAAILGPISRRMNFSRLNKDQLVRILSTQRKFANPAKKPPQALQALCRKEYFRDALDFFEITCLASGNSPADAAIWREVAFRLPKPSIQRTRVRVRRKGETPVEQAPTHPQVAATTKRKPHRGPHRKPDAGGHPEP